MKILICGFTGAGKTTFLKKLQGNPLKYQFFDLDEQIARELKIPENQIGDWITANGIKFFRDIELASLKSTLSHSSDVVLALGGGALSDEALSFIRQDSQAKLVFLDTEFLVCHQRISGDSNRLLSKISVEQLKIIYQERRVNYLKADLILSEKQTKEIEGLESLLHNL